MMNLISNAYKFTSAGGIEVTIKLITAHTLLGRERRLDVTVEDTGVGISAEDQQKLFKMFSMVGHHKSKYNSRGTGLGLTITQKLVHLLGGEVKLTSEENKGTKVSFYVKEKLEMRNEEEYDKPGEISQNQSSVVDIKQKLHSYRINDIGNTVWETSFDNSSPKILNRVFVQNTKR
jgi:DNA topoisomerase VI subunit B